MKNSDVFKVTGEKYSAKYLIITIFSLTLAACSSSSSENELNPNGQVAGSVGDTQANMGTETNAQPAADSITNLENSTDANAGSGDNISLIGTVRLELGEPDSVAIFQKNSQNLSATQIQNNFSPSLDTCEVSVVTGDDIEASLEGLTIEPYSAGDVLTLTSPAGTYAELAKLEEDGIPYYAIADEGTLPATMPPGTVLDIPGDEFPAFSGVAVPEVAKLTNLVLSTGGTLNANSTFTWDASSVAGTYIVLTAIFLSGVEESESNPNSLEFIPIYNTVSCSLVDDGAFSFPAEIAAQLGSDFEDRSFVFSRVSNTIEQRGNALVTVTVSSSNR